MGVMAMAMAMVMVMAPALLPGTVVHGVLEGLPVDRAARWVEVRGAGAPSLRAPSAEIARVEAERAARAVAGRRLRAWLAALPVDTLGCRGGEKLPRIDEAVTRAVASEVDWGSDGSVKLTLRVRLDDLVTTPPTATAGSVDGGTASAGTSAAAGPGAAAAPGAAARGSVGDAEKGTLFVGEACETARAPAPVRR